MIRNLLLTSVLAAGSFAALPAEARVITSGHVGGYSVDYINESANVWTPDHLVIYGPSGRESIQVTCTNSYSTMQWNSYGPNSQAWVNHIATEWCF